MTQFKNSNLKIKILSSTIFIFVTLIFMEVSFNLLTMLKLAQNNFDIGVALSVLIFVPTILVLAVEFIWKIFSPIVEITYHAAKSEEAKSIATAISQSSSDGARSIREKINYDIGSINGEMGRFKFVCYNCLGLLLIAPILQVISYFSYYDWFDLVVLGPLILLAIYIFYKLFIIPCAKRTVSLGLNPWLTLALLIPAINIPVYIFMVFAPKGAARKLLS